MQDLLPIQFSYLIPLLPLLGAMVAGFFGARWLKQKSHWPIWLGVGASAVLSVWLLVGMLGLSPDAGFGSMVVDESAGPRAGSVSSLGHLAIVQEWFTWIQAGDFNVSAGFFVDPLTAVMLCVVCGIGFLITVFAAGYMHGEAGYWRFFAYLGLFIFMMTCLVMGNNLIMLYLGWEGVGLCSYLLVGYYYDRPEARDAATKAFIVNRIGDFGFAIGILLVFSVFGTVNFFAADGSGFLQQLMQPGFYAGLNDSQKFAFDAIPFCLMLGAFGKSAQFPLYVWLPDAMAGPTPVSALIHAATMVTAGVYMIVRCGPLFYSSPAALLTIGIVGALTAVLGATIALRQYDLKKVFAYSTVSQLGFMFVAVAAVAPVAAVFHLVTHAFFKALLFLGSGVVMHACNDVLDMRQMSGLKRHLPKTRWLMAIGCAALAGLPLMSGFFSKDEIIAGAWHSDVILACVMLFTAFLTAYYAFRLYYRVFQGTPLIPRAAGAGHADLSGHEDHPGHAAHDAHGSHNHEPWIMIGPLVILAAGAIFAGLLNFPFKILPAHQLGNFLGESPSLKLGYAAASQAFSHEAPDAHSNGNSSATSVAASTDESAAFETPIIGHIPPLQFGQHRLQALRSSDQKEHDDMLHMYLMIGSGAIAVFGWFLARTFHWKNRSPVDQTSAVAPGVVRVLENKYWVDEIYDALIVKPLRWLAGAFYGFDRLVVDGVVGLISFVPQFAGFAMKFTTQRGHLQGYAASMLLALVVILWIVLM